FRTDDIHEHPRFHGWWPARHPDMRSFLGVPIVAPEGVIGAFYLTEKEGPPPAGFGPVDQELIELLAAHAAIAITNARLYERSRELTIVGERNRLALELHDVVSQKLFGLVLAAESAMTLLDRDGAGDRSEARAQMERAQALGREAQDELRSVILELRPPALARDGLEGVLRKHVDLVGRLHGIEIELTVEGAPGGDDRRDLEVLRVAQEALQNALRHAAADRIEVRLAAATPGRLVLEVTDDGAGFDPDDPAPRARHLGLTSMHERARRLGGALEIRSTPGSGTAVRLVIPLER
ncbi:MAG TPA: GAF domain-containing sensor histidine kinase, partial [Solirubrobacteraceae bacterium]|nr:GAF domain-containing sensor histidine kinase [Solirubrobacteraceae bacterium]